MIRSFGFICVLAAQVSSASGALGPAWTREEMEKPAGTKDMGTWKQAVFTAEQQERLKVNENGEARKEEFLGFDWGKIDRLACEELRKCNGDKKAAIVNVCKDVTKNLPFLQEQCEAIVSKTMAALDKKCAGILPTTTPVTTTTPKPKLAVLGEQFLSLFSGEFDKSKVEKLANTAMEAVPSDVKDAAEKAGLIVPTPHDLVCKGLSNTNMENRTERAICHILPNPKEEVLEACYKAVGFVWGQEAASMKCPNAPEPWWPFSILHGVVDKLICYEVQNGQLAEKQKEITDNICNEISSGRVEHYSCEAALKHVFKHYEEKCTKQDEKEQLPQGADFLV